MLMKSFLHLRSTLTSSTTVAGSLRYFSAVV